MILMIATRPARLVSEKRSFPAAFALMTEERQLPGDACGVGSFLGDDGRLTDHPLEREIHG